MLFNSYVFIAVFLPVVFFGFYLIGHCFPKLASGWLALASLFFYGWWDVRFVPLLLGSAAFNYAAASFMGGLAARDASGRAKQLLGLAVAVNLILLGYFKYAHFFVENINRLAGTEWALGEVFLPLGISFFTFTQIAFLVDTYQGKVKESNLVHYLLFVTYFPHLIAGPILHHKQMMPQFASRDICRLHLGNISAGLGIFVLGLAKKLWLADPFGEIATPLFNAVATGAHPMTLDAWSGALAYTLQLYFDFSGYSDMAIGLSLLFNVRLPLNFNSPYKSTSIIEFWRRWHMTLSQYLRDYLYFPLGGSRCGQVRRYGNLLATMLLGGLWHGAGWTFVVWGGLHGFYLMVNHAWRALKKRAGWGEGGRLAFLGAGALTFVSVVIGWVFFRANSIASALAILEGMAGQNGTSLPKLDVSYIVTLLAVGLAVVWGLPNVRQLFGECRPTCDEADESESQVAPTPAGWMFRFSKWKPTTLQGAVYGLLFVLLMLYMVSAAKSEFLYFQF